MFFIKKNPQHLEKGEDREGFSFCLRPAGRGSPGDPLRELVRPGRGGQGGLCGKRAAGHMQVRAAGVKFTYIRELLSSRKMFISIGRYVFFTTQRNKRNQATAQCSRDTNKKY